MISVLKTLLCGITDSLSFQFWIQTIIFIVDDILFGSVGAILGVLLIVAIVILLIQRQ